MYFPRARSFTSSLTENGLVGTPGRACWTVLLMMLAIPAPMIANAQSTKTNVVLILADDLGWRDLSCTGSTFYESPNLDQLAKRSFRFSQGYAACQVCSPSRVAIMTGKFPARLKTTDYFGAASGQQWKRNTRLLPAPYVDQLPAEEVTMAEAFRKAGYRTFFAGKWHMGGEGSYPEDHGFEFNVGGHRRGSPPGGFFSPYKNPKMGDGPAGESLPLRLGQATADFIHEHREEPFFAMLSFYSVHAPLQTTPKLWKKYRDKATSTEVAKKRFKLDRTPLPVRQVQDHPVYAGMIESMDQAVGLVLQRLEDDGLAEQTVVVFTSDNGGVSAGDAKATSNLPLRGGKGRQWEGGIREPYFIFVPGRPEGQDIDTPVISTDLYPTLLELCGLDRRPEQHLDGVSLIPLFQGLDIAPRPLYWHYPHYGNQGGEPAAMLRDGDYKLIYYFEDQRSELYQLSEDPVEEKDLAARRPAVVKKMKSQLLSWLDSIEANRPLPNPNYDPEAAKQALRRAETNVMPILERQHAAFLNEDFRPNPTWWGSQLDGD